MLKCISPLKFLAVTSLATLFSPIALRAAEISFHTSPPTPDSDDPHNFIGASRDGLNVNDSNGLDGPIDDNYTYVANDRPRQGQTFRTPPSTQVYRLQSLWLQIAGYTNNGAMPEPGFNGTETDFSVGGVFTFRIRDPSPTGGLLLTGSYAMTGNEPNNPNPAGRLSTTNGPGTWMKFVFSGSTNLLPDKEYAFDVVSAGAANRLFEWLGTRDDVYAGGSAYNGTQLGLGSSLTERTTNPLVGDRVFMVQMVLVPEPGTAALGVVSALTLLVRRRIARTPWADAVAPSTG